MSGGSKWQGDWETTDPDTDTDTDTVSVTVTDAVHGTGKGP